MKKTLAILLTAVFVFSCGFFGNNKPVIQAKTNFTDEQIAPIDRDSVIDKLVEDGKLSKDASQDQITKALKEYIGNATYKKPVNKLDKKREALNQKKIEEGLKVAEAKGNQLGQSKKNNLDPAKSVEYGNPVKTVKVLVLLGEFADLDHNKIEKPADLNRTYWTNNFVKEHYQSLLFDDGYYTTPEGTKSPTFKQYFKEQSNGNLNVEGEVFGWYKVSKDAKYYGEDNDSSHNIHAKDFIKEVTEAAVKDGLDLSEYDIEDPYDLDSDKNLMEPDGIVDHLMVIHSGMGQEAGGGVIGDDAIWSHSSSVGLYEVPGANGMSIYSYTTEAENGSVGLFTHEFVHDLGIPDDYDTQYTADGDIVEYWSLMAGGSWSGAPGGTMPTGINPYSRIMLGLIHGGNWINWNYADFNELQSGKMTLDTATMNTGNAQAILVNLPKENNILTLNTPFQGAKEFWGGEGEEADHNMTVKVDLTGKTSANLTYNIWYEIEENWDAGFIQVSEDGSKWTSLATPHTVSDFNNPDAYPTIMDSFPAYTGTSNGWIQENIDLSAYAGKEISIRFRYATDWGSEYRGMFIDSVNVTADGQVLVSEDAENGFGSFTADGFEVTNGTKGNNHYYVAEWRSHLGVDEGLKYNARAKVEYNQGMALWYINKNYSDNWVGVHPGYGQLGIVDSTQYVYMNAGLGNGNESGIRAGYMPFVQLHDAAFSLDKAADMDLSIYLWAKNPNLKAKQATPLFDDSQSYFSVKSPYSGLKLPNLGLKIRVTGVAPDYSRGEISITK